MHSANTMMYRQARKKLYPREEMIQLSPMNDTAFQPLWPCTMQPMLVKQMKHTQAACTALKARVLDQSLLSPSQP
jgi:hypothetical protein